MSPILEIDASTRQLTLTYQDGRVTRYTATHAAVWEHIADFLGAFGEKRVKSELLRCKKRWLDQGWITAETLTEPTPYAERMADELAENAPNLVKDLEASLRVGKIFELSLVASEEQIAGELD